MARTFYFSEDFGAELQFTPRENVKEAKERLRSFAVVDSQAGWRDYDCRPLAVSLGVRGIPFLVVNSIFCDILQPYTEFRFDISREEMVEDMFAFGSDDFVLCGGYDQTRQKLVSWLNFFMYAVNPEQRDFFDRLAGAVEYFCLQYDLLLVDLDGRLVIDFFEQKKAKDLFSDWLCHL